ncbi:kinesin-domain-containing protein [Violaceomyces palustris]|uniref:Kinesin-domain-containing protein n=1 Tax=Violaceomyces palustris TaxID=1673888 RepID=A0ACD0NRQ5_9BASI|nr:kinesin-domain-containing protein [Violaceomyces palustris]
MASSFGASNRRSVSQSSSKAPLRAGSTLPPSSRRPTVTSSSRSKQQQQQHQQQDVEDPTQARRKCEGDETNIQVVVRVRGRAPSEPKPSSPSILSTSGPRCSRIDVAVEPQPVSSLSSMHPSLVQEAATREKSYNFDQVFGPEADQGMVYQDVVVPILQEVMSGYNCTIFAYGQTGTGKTHTMEGDLTAHMGTYSSEAGIIPRTLYKLFHTLELSKDDYSVKASFVELYNEELRDLLSTDSPPSTGNISSGKGIAGSNNASREPPTGSLKMYDDAKGRGVSIQGLEEVAMSDAAHGLSLLRRGSQKRQIAATRCNESSSRSHSVFTLTVHIKETGSKGEDVLRIGKLNLVDLAGSENIGRSGAENKRAREAGMINQSLLTLGRVINALVEKSSHVPYRESKLTRLLQESLGGRTKTCIIATVSGDKSNLEETLSTLDYALRAKSIRNRPELNTRMTRSALIKEYVSEIERLKSDLLASREQNGIYLSEESWKMMQDEHETSKTQAEESRRHVEVIESKLNSLKEQFEQNMQLLVKRDSEVKASRAECAEKTAELESLISQVNKLHDAVAEERTLKEAYLESETRLDRIASQLRQVAKESTGDVERLLAKIERKSAVETKNESLIAEYKTSLSSMTAELEGRVVDFRTVQENFLEGLASGLKVFASREAEEIASNQVYVEEQLTSLASLSRALKDGHESGYHAVVEVADEIDAVLHQLNDSTKKRTEMLMLRCQGLTASLLESHGEQLGRIRHSIESMSDLVVGAARQATETLTLHASKIMEARSASQKAAEDDFAALQAQNEFLNSLVVSEKSKSKQMREELASNIMSMISSFVTERDEDLSKAVSGLQKEISSSQKMLKDRGLTQEYRLSELAKESDGLKSSLELSAKATQERFSEGCTAIDHSSSSISNDLQNFSEEFRKDIDGGAEEVRGAAEQFGKFTEQLRDRVRRNRETQEKQLHSLTKEVTEAYRLVQTEMESTSSDIQSTCQAATESIHGHKGTSESFLGGTASHLSNMRAESRSYLTQQMVVDVPTGDTPQKRAWHYPESWGLVQRIETPVRRSVGKSRLSKVDGLAATPSGEEASLGNTELSIDCSIEKADHESNDDTSMTGSAGRSGDEEIKTSEVTPLSGRPLRELTFGHNRAGQTPQDVDEKKDMKVAPPEQQQATNTTLSLRTRSGTNATTARKLRQ